MYDSLIIVFHLLIIIYWWSLFITATVEDIVTRGGSCLIPVFALGRAQELLLILDEYWQVRERAKKHWIKKSFITLQHTPPSSDSFRSPFSPPPSPLSSYSHPFIPTSFLDSLSYDPSTPSPPFSPSHRLTLSCKRSQYSTLQS